MSARWICSPSASRLITIDKCDEKIAGHLSGNFFAVRPTAGGFLFGSACQGRFFTSCRPWRRRQSSTGRSLPAGSFDPTLLSCAKKRGVEPPRRNCPKETLGKGFLWTPSENRGVRPLWLPGAARYGHVTNRACLRTFACSVVEGYDKFGRPDSAQSKFPLEISLRGECLLCNEAPVPHCSPPRKDFCRAKMPCGGQVPPNLLLGRKIVRYSANQ